MNQTNERAWGREYRWAEGSSQENKNKDWERKKQEFKWSERAQESVISQRPKEYEFKE